MCLQDTSYLSLANPQELFVSDQIDERIKLNHIHAACKVSYLPFSAVMGSRIELPSGSTHFCLYHWDHATGRIEQLNARDIHA